MSVRFSCFFFKNEGRVAVIITGVQGEFPGLQAGLDEFFSESTKNGKEGDTEEHSRDAKQAAHDGNGNNDPERTETGAFTEDFRADDVAVQLLDQKDQDNEPNGLGGISDEDNKRAGDGTDEGAEEWDHIGDTYDNGNQRIIGHFENCKDDEGKNTDDQRIKELTYNEAAKGSVRVDSKVKNAFLMYLLTL